MDTSGWSLAQPKHIWCQITIASGRPQGGKGSREAVPTIAAIWRTHAGHPLTSLVTRGTPKCQKWSFSSPLYTTFPKRAMLPVLHSPFPGLVSAKEETMNQAKHFKKEMKENIYGHVYLNRGSTSYPLCCSVPVSGICVWHMINIGVRPAYTAKQTNSCIEPPLGNKHTQYTNTKIIAEKENMAVHHAYAARAHISPVWKQTLRIAYEDCDVH